MLFLNLELIRFIISTKNGSLFYQRTECDYLASCEVALKLNRTNFEAYKGWVNAVVDRGTGIPDLIEYENGRGFDIVTPSTLLINYKITQSYNDPVSYKLVYSNIEPITIYTSWIDSTVFRRSTYYYTVIEDNFGNQETVSLSLLSLIAPIPLFIFYKLRTRKNNK